MTLIVDQQGPVPDAQQEKAQLEIKERNRVRTLSNDNLVGEVKSRLRDSAKTGNLLQYAYGLVLLPLLNSLGAKGARLDSGNDPYRLQSPHRSKGRRGHVLKTDGGKP
jgi:hypothetical protein